MRKLAVSICEENIGVTPFATAAAIKAAGFQQVFIQWYDRKTWGEDNGYDQQEVVDYVKRKQLEIIFAHLGYQTVNDLWREGDEGDDLTERYLRNLDECCRNGINEVLLHLTKGTEVPAPSAVGLERIERLLVRGQQLGMTVSFENNWAPGFQDYVFENLKHYDNLGICFDAGHDHKNGETFDFERFRGRITCVHLHDNFGEHDSHLLPFDGNISWPRVIKQLREADYQGPVTLELKYRGDYLNMPLTDYFKEAYKRAGTLRWYLEG
ncbi:MAG: sugar phosphate isomerase/epimerase [Erysipelotrichaceae bacterium]|nr:sugar phosphate isomerase/epimerase [Erysipelotrichaceae bacterium]